MYFPGGDQWTYGISTDPDIDFCVQVLLLDGLRVPPFDQHRDGDHRFRDLGLTAAGWRSWYEAEVRRHPAHGEFREPPTMADHLDFLYAPESPTMEAVERYRRHFQEDTAAGRITDPRLRPALLRLWVEVTRRRREAARRRFSELRSRGDRVPPQAKQQAMAARQRSQWEAMQQYRPLPPLLFLAVEYPVRVVDVFPPDRAVLGMPDPEPPGFDEDEELDIQVLEAARRLSGR